MKLYKRLYLQKKKKKKKKKETKNVKKKIFIEIKNRNRRRRHGLLIEKNILETEFGNYFLFYQIKPNQQLIYRQKHKQINKKK